MLYDKERDYGQIYRGERSNTIPMSGDFNQTIGDYDISEGLSLLSRATMGGRNLPYSSYFPWKEDEDERGDIRDEEVRKKTYYQKVMQNPQLNLPEHFKNRNSMKSLGKATASAGAEDLKKGGLIQFLKSLF